MEERDSKTKKIIGNIPERDISPKETRNFLVKCEKDDYNLYIEYDENNIYFKVEQTNNIASSYYKGKYDLNTIINKMEISRNNYYSFEKFMKFYKKAIDKKLINLIYQKEKKKMILRLTRIIDFEEVVSDLELEEVNLGKDELFKKLINEVNNLKEKNKYSINNENEILLKEINELKNEIKELKEKKLVELQNEIKIIEEEKNKELKLLNNEVNLINKKLNIFRENKKIKNEEKLLKNEGDLKENEPEQEIEKIYQISLTKDLNELPINLKYKYDIINTNNVGYLCEFAAYTSIKDEKEYLASGNKDTYNIDIIKLEDNSLVYSLKGHITRTYTVKYFVNKKEEKENIISADKNKNIIVWDITNNYEIIHNIITGYNGKILSTLLLFDIFDKNYIIASSYNLNDDSRVYSFKDSSFVKNIYNTKNNQTCHIIPWFYNNNYYIIELCIKKISINNLLENKNYAELILEPESCHNGGFIYNDNYLCCSSENGLIRVWNLIKKTVSKVIEIEDCRIFEIIQWSSKYFVAANRDNDSLDIIDIDEERVIKQIEIPNNSSVSAIKKIYHSIYGECLLTSTYDNIIRFWSA